MLPENEPDDTDDLIEALHQKRSLEPILPLGMLPEKKLDKVPSQEGFQVWLKVKTRQAQGGFPGTPEQVLIRVPQYPGGLTSGQRLILIFSTCIRKLDKPRLVWPECLVGYTYLNDSIGQFQEVEVKPKMTFSLDQKKIMYYESDT